MRPVEEQTQAVRSRPLNVVAPTTLSLNRRQSSALGNLLCDLLMAAIPGHDVCILNSGGIRRALGQGPIRYGGLYDVLPFGNLPASVTMRGDALLELIRIATSGAHGVLQVSGLRVDYDLGADPCPTEDRDGDGVISDADKNRLISARLANGSEIDPNESYRILTSNFLALGGDHMGSVMNKLPKGQIQIDSNDKSIRDHIARQLGVDSTAIVSGGQGSGQKARVVHPRYNDKNTELRVKAIGALPKTECNGE